MRIFYRSRMALWLFSLLVLTATALGTSRMEYLLEERPAPEVMNLLRCRYPNARFSPHPTMNGFYMSGTVEDMLSVKRDLVRLDTPSPLPEPPELTTVIPKSLSPAELASMIRLWFPDAQCEPADDALVFRGEAQIRDRAIATFRELDFPHERIRVSRRQLAEASARVCAFPESPSAWKCPMNDCGGILHLTGLRVGDEVMSKTTREHPHAPFWVVYRGGIRLNIFVDFE